MMLSLAVEVCVRSLLGYLISAQVFCFAVVGTAVGAKCEVVYQNGSAAVLAAGAFCDTPPDELVDAPHANGGKIEHSLHRTEYVLKVDHLEARRGLGVGVAFRISGIANGEVVTERIKYPDGHSSSWEVRMTPNGVLDFGSNPPYGGTPALGRYLFSVLREGKPVITYRIVLEGVVDDELCVPEVS